MGQPFGSTRRDRVGRNPEGIGRDDESGQRLCNGWQQRRGRRRAGRAMGVDSAFAWTAGGTSAVDHLPDDAGSGADGNRPGRCPRQRQRRKQQLQRKREHGGHGRRAA